MFKDHHLTPWTTRLLAFGLPSGIGATLLWYAVKLALNGRFDFSHTAAANVVIFIVLTVVVMTLWLGAFLLFAYVVHWRSTRLVLALVCSLPLLFFMPMQFWTGLALVMVWLGLAWGLESAYDDVQNRLTVQPRASFSRGVSAAILGILVAVSLLYYQQLGGSSATTEQLTATLVAQTVTLTEKSIPLYYKGYTAGMTVDQLIGDQLPSGDSILRDVNFSALQSSQAKQQALNQKLESIGLQPNELNINVQQAQTEISRQIDAKILEFRQQTIDQTRAEIGKRFDVMIRGNETVHDAMTDIIRHQFNQHVKRFVRFVPIILALALFFFLRVLTGILQLVIVWGGWMFLLIYRQFKLIAIHQQTVPAERVEWGS